MVSFSERIKEYRTKMDKTQKEVADMLNITMQNVSNWENGKNSPQLKDIEEIAIKLGENISEKELSVCN
jgi:transcriptional regulator with XRE-family HTH domain